MNNNTQGGILHCFVLKYHCNGGRLSLGIYDNENRHSTCIYLNNMYSWLGTAIIQWNVFCRKEKLFFPPGSPHMLSCHSWLSRLQARVYFSVKKEYRKTRFKIRFLHWNSKSDKFVVILWVYWFVWTWSSSSWTTKLKLDTLWAVNLYHMGYIAITAQCKCRNKVKLYSKTGLFSQKRVRIFFLRPFCFSVIFFRFLIVSCHFSFFFHNCNNKIYPSITQL